MENMENKKAEINSSELKHISQTKDKVMVIDPRKNPIFDSLLYTGLQPQYTKLRRELFLMNAISKAQSKQHLIEVMKKDVENEEKLLKSIGIGFLPTHK